jgi:formylglycine-generating enzyme required for sulfatase activity
VLGVSYDDAEAYAAWRTARDRPLGGRGVYGLPTLAEWTFAAGHYGRRWVWGNRMRPKWCKSCFSRRHALPEPGLRYPRDESPYGLLDMAGSVAEWLDDWYDRSQNLRRIEGGSWAWAKMDYFRVWGAQGWAPGTTGDETGFRLVLREAAR